MFLRVANVNVIRQLPPETICPDMGVFEDQIERTVGVSWGEAAILELPSILSHPEPLVIWQADDAPQLYGRKYAVTARHQLIILSATDADQKAYRYCETTFICHTTYCHFQGSLC